MSAVHPWQPPTEAFISGYDSRPEGACNIYEDHEYRAFMDSFIPDSSQDEFGYLEPGSKKHAIWQRPFYKSEYPELARQGFWVPRPHVVKPNTYLHFIDTGESVTYPDTIRTPLKHQPFIFNSYIIIASKGALWEKLSDTLNTATLPVEAARRWGCPIPKRYHEPSISIDYLSYRLVPRQPLWLLVARGGALPNPLRHDLRLPRYREQWDAIRAHVVHNPEA